LENYQVIVHNIGPEDWKLAKIGAIEDNLKIGAWVALAIREYYQHRNYVKDSLNLSDFNFNIRRKV
jgi:hypothetical protein